MNISRIFSHELCRHRLSSFSQESLRYVRLTELKCYYPKAFKRDSLLQIVREVTLNHNSESEEQAVSELEKKLINIFKTTFETLENTQKHLADLLQLDNLKFDLKKRLTSAMRRLAPIGLATHIIMTANHRNWRHVLEMRSDQHAEEEIQDIFSKLGHILINRYPNIYQDVVVTKFGEFKFYNSKV